MDWSALIQQNFDSVITGFFGILGVLLGLAVSVIGFLYKERRQATSTKMILKAEMDRNLQLVQGIWENAKLTRLPIEHALTEPAISNAALWQSVGHQVLQRAFPALGSKVWESQLSFVARVLNKREIEQVLGFYSQLAAIKGYFDELAESDESTWVDEEEEPERPFDDRVYPLAYGFLKTIADLINKGNPLTA